MALDFDMLVSPLSDDAPSGPDLYADSERQAIEQAFERSVSATDASEDEIDWAGIARRIIAQAEQTRDLWLPVYLMRAGAAGRNLERVVDGAELFARMLEDRWADCHPQLEELGFIGRKTPCESLTRLGEFLNPLQQVPLLSHPRLGVFSAADFQRFESEGVNADGYGMFRALLDESDADTLREVVAKVDAILDGIRRGDAVLTDNAEGDTATNFEPTYDVLQKMRRAIASFLPDEPTMPLADPFDAATDHAPASTMAGNSGPAGASFSGAITSRADVVRAIDAICAYYSHYEPGSPVPLALRRVRDWTSLDFLAVLEDIAPGGISEAGLVLKSRKASAGSVDSGGGGDTWGSSSSSDSTWGSSSESSSESSGWN